MEFFLEYSIPMMGMHAVGLLLCTGVLRTRFESQAHLSQVTELAHIDHLTGLPNRRALEKALTGRPPDEPGCFLLVDVDRFKQVNDRYAMVWATWFCRPLPA